MRDFCLCAGSRNSPLIAVASAASGLTNFSFPDERAAAFFALGRSKATGRPAAVITTSGTAVAELLPAVIEAWYSGTPLVLITADRPRRFRGTGAPQAIEQRGIFGPYCEISIDIEAGESFDLAGWSRRFPLHINVAFDEPLLEGEIPRLTLDSSSPSAAGRSNAPSSAELQIVSDFLRRHRQPLVILGGLDPQDRDAVKQFLETLGAPVYAEALSGLRTAKELRHLTIASGERILSRAGFDSVLRIGGIPTLRFWRDLEDAQSGLPVLNITSLPFPGLSRGEIVISPPGDILNAVDPPRRSMGGFHDQDRAMSESIESLFLDEPRAELSMIHHLSKLPGDGSSVFLGNSLPIREWDLAAVRDERAITFRANRGANGIDGAISTFLGAAREKDNWAILGDLTVLYDLSAPWILPQLNPGLELRLVVINNGGGRIFGRVKSLERVDADRREKFFENGHNISFEDWARMWKLAYERWVEIPADAPSPQHCVVEVTPDPRASARLWERFDSLWRDA